MNIADRGGTESAGAENKAGDRPLLPRKSMLMGMLTSGFVIAAATQPSTAAAGTTKPIATIHPLYAQEWRSATVYTLGQQVISPNNDVVAANVAHSSSARFANDAAKWTLSSTFASKATETAVVSGRLSATSLAAALVGPALRVLYVSTTGNDANTGGTTGAAKLTIGAAVAALGGMAGKILVLSGTYEVTASIPLNARQSIVGHGGLGMGTVAEGNSGVRIVAVPGFEGDYVFDHADSFEGDSWHWGSLEGVSIDCNKAAGVNVGGVHIFEWGEEAVIRRVNVYDAGRSGYLFTGTHAVGRMEYSSAWHSEDYGVKIVGPGGLGSGSGSLLLHGVSGDDNAPGWLYHNGSAEITEISPKHERLNDGGAGWTMDGQSTGGGRARLSIVGGRFEAAFPGVQTVVRIVGTGTPSITVKGISTPNFDVMIDDQVKAQTIPCVGQQGPAFVVWAQDGDESIYLDARNVHLGANVKVRGTAMDNPSLRLNNGLDAGYDVWLQSNYSEAPLSLGINSQAPKQVWRVGGYSAATTQTFSVYSGTMAIDILALTADGITVGNNATALPAATLAHRGQIRRLDGGTGVADRLVTCRKSAADIYEWVDLY